MCQFSSPADPTISGSFNHSWPSESSRGFSHLWPRVFHILYRYAKHNREGERKEQTNKHGLGSAPSTRSGVVYVTLFVHSVFLWANASMYSSENSRKATSNADLTSHVGHTGIYGSTGPSSYLLTSVDWSPLCPTFISLNACTVDWFFLLPFCWLSSSLLPTVLWDIPSLVVSGLVGDLVRKLFVRLSRQNRQRDSLTGTHTHRNGCHP